MAFSKNQFGSCVVFSFSFWLSPDFLAFSQSRKCKEQLKLLKIRSFEKKPKTPRKQKRASLNQFLYFGIKSSRSPAKIAK
jgi:hypothetical protein